ncbi:hypothetical protein L873DRAFT_1801539 [Choiromyces venosus 120613-1]|uniref:Uncharacterized protein n=1 Tax=Choiromyces venosus 120613-1 TaxID=1336337 RepID=A0A3N4JX61_9PEZI|nr:hypothetical protein L873DRAFT_1801539 [Choiromyces venosus 120613-1]
MSDRNYGGEDHPDLSEDTLTELSLQEGGDTPSRTLSPCESWSNNLTPLTRGVHSDGGPGLVSTERSGRRDATADAVKQPASSAETIALIPLPDMKREFIKTFASSEIDNDMLLLPDFSIGLVGKDGTKNGCHELSLIDLMSLEEVNCMGCKFNALIPTKSPKIGSGSTNTVSELIMNDSKVVDRAPKLEFEDSFDCLNGLFNVDALEPEGLSSPLIPAVLGSFVKENASKSLKNSCYQTLLMDSCIVEDQLIDGAEQPMMPSTCPSDSASRCMPQPSLPQAGGDAERVEKNKSVFAWIDAVIISACHMSETMTTTSPVTSDLIDLFTTNLFVVRSPLSVLPLVLAHQLPAGNSSGISILDLDCDYSGPPVSPDLKHTTITTSLNSALPIGDLLLLDSGNDALDCADGGGPNPSFPCLIESPTSHNLALSGTLTPAIPPHLRGASEYPPIQKEVGRMRTVVKVVISAPKAAKEGREEGNSLISGPIISARTASDSEVGNAAWTRWVEDNAEKASVASLTWNPARQNPPSEKPRGGISTVPQRGRAVVNPKVSKRVTVSLSKGGHEGVQHTKNMAPSSSRNNNRTVSNGTSHSSQVKLTAGQTRGHPVRAVSNSAVAPTLAQRPITLAPPEAAPVTWSGSGLPFEGLASRRGIVPLGAVGYHNPKTVSYKRTSMFNRQEKIREQLRGTRQVASPRPKVSPSTLVKEDTWASQEADFLRASGPADPCSLLNSFWLW